MQNNNNIFEDISQLDSSHEQLDNIILESYAFAADGCNTLKHEGVSFSSRLLWRQGNSSDFAREYEYLGPEHEFPNSLKQPLQYFKLFFTAEFMQLLVYQSSLYSDQVNPNKLLNITTGELKRWLGIAIYFRLVSYLKLVFTGLNNLTGQNRCIKRQFFYSLN